ncbi:hypothetical protein Enr13x_28200 [Stieleria neptunia]|uniref:Uncharacterized protein n=1 Tax=Stieleria neptunia TaxID=2527979 RepID=A0A518HQ52_9BACT|nr:hypothetical protein Enr13x_28200 [Stieleria neptunia]
MGLITLAVGAGLGRYLNYRQATDWQRALTAVSGFVGFFFWLLMAQVAFSSNKNDTVAGHVGFFLAGVSVGMISRYLVNSRGRGKGKSNAATEDPRDRPTEQPWLLLRAQWVVPAYWLACLYASYCLTP